MGRKLIKNIIPVAVVIFISAALVAMVLARYTSWVLAYITFSAVIGISFFEVAWARAVRYRDLNEERDQHFPAFRRLDSHSWKKAMFYPFAASLFTTRMIIGLGSFAACAGMLKIITLGHKKGQPLTGLRAKLNKGVY